MSAQRTTLFSVFFLAGAHVELGCVHTSLYTSLGKQQLIALDRRGAMKGQGDFGTRLVPWFQPYQIDRRIAPIVQ
jgi:hypothetical protein